MTLELTEDEKTLILESRKAKDEVAKNPPKPPSKKKELPAPETPPPPPAVPPTEPPAPAPVPPERDTLLEEIEKDLIAKLKDTVKLEEFKDFDLRTRIKIYRSLEKTATPSKGAGTDPTFQAPPNHEGPKTLTELNNMKDYLHDVQKTHSMLNMTNKIRGKT